MNLLVDIIKYSRKFERVQLILSKIFCDSGIGYFLSENPNISEDTQLILARDDYWVRYYLEGNPNLFESARLIIEKMKNNDIGYKLNMSYISEHDKMIISGKVK